MSEEEFESLADGSWKYEIESLRAEPVAWFPLLGTGLAIRRSLLDERTAKRNHMQSLDRLAERGGLSPDEAIAVVNKSEWKRKETVAALRDLSVATLAAHPARTLSDEEIIEITQKVASTSDRPIGMIAFGVLVARAVLKEANK